MSQSPVVNCLQMIAQLRTVTGAPSLECSSMIPTRGNGTPITKTIRPARARAYLIPEPEKKRERERQQKKQSNPEA